jgi:hypothetical protein
MLLMNLFALLDGQNAEKQSHRWTFGFAQGKIGQAET